MYKIERYKPKQKALWDQLLRESNAGNLIIHRDFLEYHSDRFEDFSIMVFADQKLIGIMPANIVGDTWYSHQGLTFGGLYTLPKYDNLNALLKIFECLNSFLRSNNIKKTVIKPAPDFYCAKNNNPLNYILRNHFGTFIDVNIIANSTILPKNGINLSTLRKRKYKQGKKNYCVIKDTFEIEAFYHNLKINLNTRHGVDPVHTLSELLQLKNKFPDDIELRWIEGNDDAIDAGLLLFKNSTNVHAQYITSSPQGRQKGALDYLIVSYLNELLEVAPNKFFDFGSSCTEMGTKINEDLFFFKNGFGCFTSLQFCFTSLLE
ncbi:hypothetical protein HIMB11_00408 [Rhodobacteraceae bacterium HIMB11]|nr:hypothetical protein HIMB11_00408 [Rhodobacteraceae bacterium HIMB11]